MKVTKKKVIETWDKINNAGFNIQKDLSTADLSIVGMTFDQFLRFTQLNLSAEQNKQLQQVCVKNMLKKYDYWLIGSNSKKAGI